MQKGNEFRVHVRRVFKRIFYVLLDRLKIRRFGDHSFFGSLLPRSAIVVDFGAHRGQFFAALKSDYSISRALLVEANPALADPLKKTFAWTDVLHAALIGGNNRDRVTSTRSTQLESPSIFREWAAAWCGDQWKFRQPSLQASFES
jgi:hypothetical protein